MKIELNNSGPVDSGIANVYFPRLQINKIGEIVLAISKEGTLTTGILVGKKRDCKSKLKIG